VLKARALPVDPSGPFWEEWVWGAAIDISGQSFISTPSVDVATLVTLGLVIDVLSAAIPTIKH